MIGQSVELKGLQLDLGGTGVVIDQLGVEFCRFEIHSHFQRQGAREITHCTRHFPCCLRAGFCPMAGLDWPLCRTCLNGPAAQPASQESLLRIPRSTRVLRVIGGMMNLKSETQDIPIWPQSTPTIVSMKLPVQTYPRNSPNS